jgi:hypothetical protein
LPPPPYLRAIQKNQKISTRFRVLSTSSLWPTFRKEACACTVGQSQRTNAQLPSSTYSSLPSNKLSSHNYGLVSTGALSKVTVFQCHSCGRHSSTNQCCTPIYLPANLPQSSATVSSEDGLNQTAASNRIPSYMPLPRRLPLFL